MDKNSEKVYRLGIKKLSNILRKKNDDVTALIDRAYNYNQVEEYQRAINDLNIALGLKLKKKQKVIAFVERAFARNRIGDDDGALDDTDEAIKLNKKYVKALNEKSRALFMMDKYDESLEWIEKSIKINKKDPASHIYRGIILGKLKRFDEAIKCHELALQLDDKNEKALFNLGWIHKGMETYDKAMVFFKRVVELGETRDLHRSYNALGDIQISLKDESKAEEYYLLSVQCNSTENNVCGILKLCRLLIKDPSKINDCITHLETLKILKENPANYIDRQSGLKLLAEAYKRIKKYDLSIGILEDVLTKGSHDNEGLNFKVAELYMLGNKPKKAVPYFYKVIDLDPKNSKYHFLLAQNLQKLDRMDECVDMLNKACELDSGNFKAHDMLQEILQAKIRKTVNKMQKVNNLLIK